jgi:hypothetical protein
MGIAAVVTTVSGEDTVPMTPETSFSVLWSPSGLNTTGNAASRHKKLTYDSTLDTYKSGLVRNATIDTEKVLGSNTGLETGTNFSEDSVAAIFRVLIHPYHISIMHNFNTNINVEIHHSHN